MSSSTRRHAVPLLPPYTDGVRGRVLTSSDICAFTPVCVCRPRGRLSAAGGMQCFIPREA